MNDDQLSEISKADLQSVARLFFAGLSPSLISFPPSLLGESSQMALLHATVSHPDNAKYPLSRKYVVAFLKEFIRQVEARSECVADAVYETLVSLVNDSGRQESFFKIYQLHNGSVVRVRENAITLSEGSTGLSHWQATYYFSEYVKDNIDQFRNKKILELGCGLGLLGLTVIQLAQPSDYVFTDFNASVLRMLRENIVSTFELEKVQMEDLLNGADVSVNNGATRVRVQELDWTYWSSENDRSLAESLDIVLAADVAYDPSAVSDFNRIVAALLTSPTVSTSVSAFIAHTIRHESTFDLLRSELASNACKTTVSKITIPTEIEKRTLPNCSPGIDFECVLLRVVPS